MNSLTSKQLKNVNGGIIIQTTFLNHNSLEILESKKNFNAIRAAVIKYLERVGVSTASANANDSSSVLIHYINGLGPKIITGVNTFLPNYIKAQHNT